MGGRYRIVVPDVEYWRRMVPCQAACPVRTDAGKYVQLVAEGAYETATPSHGCARSSPTSSTIRMLK
ncbi:hypothetical protein HRbin08_01444 [bacterium HR08]|nr:hypothetical protein HRbin08_01444 [bacterium HR08]